MARTYNKKPKNDEPATPEVEAAQPEPSMEQASPNAAVPPAAGLTLHAQPQRRRVAPANANLPIIASVVFAIVSTGAKGKIDIVPLHEVPLLRRKIALQEPASETPKVLAEYPSHLDRVRGKTMLDLRSEYARLIDRYKFEKPNGREGEEVNLVADFYGTGLGQLRATMLRIEQGWKQIKAGVGEDQEPSDEQLEELVTLADPDFELSGGTGDGIEYQPYEPAGAGSVVGLGGDVILKRG